MKSLVWTAIIAVGLASLPFGSTAFAGQNQAKHAHKIAAHAGKAGKHHGNKHHNKSAGKNHHHQ